MVCNSFLFQKPIWILKRYPKYFGSISKGSTKLILVSFMSFNFLKKRIPSKWEWRSTSGITQIHLENRDYNLFDKSQWDVKLKLNIFALLIFFVKNLCLKLFLIQDFASSAIIVKIALKEMILYSKIKKNKKKIAKNLLKSCW